MLTKRDFIKRMPRIVYYNIGSILVQLMALNMLFLNTSAAATMLVLDTAFMLAYTMLLAKNDLGISHAANGRKHLLMDSVGCRKEKFDDEEEMVDIMRDKESNADQVCVEGLDRDFERIEQISAESVLSISDDDIEGILKQKRVLDEAEN